MNIKLATVSLNQIPLDWRGNKYRIIDAIKQCKKQKIQLICFPELSISGYGCEDVFLADYIYDLSLKSLQDILSYTQEIIACVGFPFLFENKRYNAAAVMYNKKLLGIVIKNYLPKNDIYYENRWFENWQNKNLKKFRIFNQDIFIGNQLFKFGELFLGIEICEDAWVANEDSSLLNYLQKAHIVCNLSASHFTLNKSDYRYDLVCQRAKKLNVIYLYTNLCGNESGRILYDGSCLIANSDGILSQNRGFYFEDFQISSAVCQFHLVSSLNSIDEEINNNIKIIEYDVWQKFYFAETMGLFDYLRKSKNCGFILSLSGGVDSAVCAVLVCLMVERAIKELGLEKFKQKFFYFDVIQNKKSIIEIKKEFLICVYQATNNSSNITKNAAKKLADFLGATYHYYDVQEILDSYTSLVENSLNKQLNWQDDNLTLQNIQARVRAPSVWMLANVRKALLLSTSNLSEIAVGYATMDGDTAGGLAPIGGINKTFLRQWLSILEKKGLPNYVLAQPILSLINKQKPTAELCPKSFEQSDEKDLMPYEILDFLSKQAIFLKRSPNQVRQKLEKKFNCKEILAIQYTKKFFHLWSINQWKRERYAPSFHLEEGSFDPKSWCRFPILNSAYKSELDNL